MVGGSVVYSAIYTRDKLGRIESKKENILGQVSTFIYGYDLAGRLVSVNKDGQINSYQFDDNGNRIGGTVRNKAISAQYDEQDRMVSYSGMQFTHTPTGDLASEINNSTGEISSFQYDIFGGLRSVSKSNKPVVTFKYDGENHRVAKFVDGVFNKGYLYNTYGELVGELDENKQLIAQYVYVTGTHSPDYMFKGGRDYMFVKDQLGSIRLVVDMETGDIAQKITYDEFGVVLENTNPGFQVFGYAGGLTDTNTNLVKFGARDYSAEYGRWIEKDPIQFDGGDSNLFGYVSQDPINHIDPRGLASKKYPLPPSGDDDDDDEPIPKIPEPNAGSAIADVILIKLCSEGKANKYLCHEKYGFPLPEEPKPSPSPVIKCNPILQCCPKN